MDMETRSGIFVSQTVLSSPQGMRYDLPRPYDEEFHEEVIWGCFLGVHHHNEELLIEVPVEAQVLPASLTERTCKEEAEGCLFYIHWAQDTVVITVLQLMFLSFQDVPCI